MLLNTFRLYFNRNNFKKIIYSGVKKERVRDRDRERVRQRQGERDKGRERE